MIFFYKNTNAFTRAYGISKTKFSVHLEIFVFNFDNQRTWRKLLREIWITEPYFMRFLFEHRFTFMCPNLLNIFTKKKIWPKYYWSGVNDCKFSHCSVYNLPKLCVTWFMIIRTLCNLRKRSSPRRKRLSL